MDPETRDVDQRFPITVWPSTPLGPTRVERWSLTHDPTGLLHWGSLVDKEPLPEEWVLRRLTDTDLDDDQEVAALLKDYGAISSPYFDPSAVPRERWPLLGHLPSDEEQLTDRWWAGRNDGTIEDARWWLKTARALVGVWREQKLGGNLSAWSREGFPAVNAESSYWANFVEALNEGLHPFRAHVERAVEFTTSGGEFTFGEPQVGLYSAACRQVFNLIVENGTARHCENATCGRVFVRQIGGARLGQHRSIGLRFCSPECARAETQRAYRRRKAQANTAGGAPLAPKPARQRDTATSSSKLPRATPTKPPSPRQIKIAEGDKARMWQSLHMLDVLAQELLNVKLHRMGTATTPEELAEMTRMVERAISALPGFRDQLQGTVDPRAPSEVREKVVE